MLPTQIISVQPKDQLRYPRKIWIETQHFLPLKAEAYNQDGSTLDQMMFTNLQLVSDPAADFGVTNAKDLQVKHIHATQAEPFENASFMLKNWPAGFKTVFFMRNSLEQSQKSVDHLLISDGFSSVSVYLGPKENDTVEGLHSLGSVNSFSRVIDNSQITVLGEVPVQTVEFIANGITLR